MPRKIYAVLIRGGMTDGNELRLLLMKNYKPQYWRVHGFYTSEEEAEVVRKELESPLYVVEVKSWPINMVAVA